MYYISINIHDDLGNNYNIYFLFNFISIIVIEVISLRSVELRLTLVWVSLTMVKLDPDLHQLKHLTNH